MKLTILKGGELIPTSEVDLTPPEREQSARPGTGKKRAWDWDDFECLDP